MSKLPVVIMVPVKSSLIEEAGFRQENDLTQTGTVFVRFNPRKGQPAGSGALWGYTPVPRAKYEAMMQAASIGSFFIHEIRDVLDADRKKIYSATQW